MDGIHKKAVKVAVVLAYIIYNILYIYISPASSTLRVAHFLRVSLFIFLIRVFWKKSGQPVEVGSLSHHLQGF